jgi:Fe-S-cluster containining protein
MATASPCDRCDGRCCHAYLVRVTGYDAWVISSALGLPMEEFLSYLPDPEGGGAGFMLDRSGATYGLALRQRPGERERACFFLRTLPDGRGRCSVYPHRPLVCRAFPALLDGQRAALREELVCPPGSWEASAMALPPWRRQLLALDLERTIHRLVVSRWNERVRDGPADAVWPIREYFAFLADAYGRIAPLRGEGRRQATASPPSWGRRGAPAAGSPRWLEVLGRVRDALDAS